MVGQIPSPPAPTGAGPEAVEAPIPVEVVYTAPHSITEAQWWVEHYLETEVAQCVIGPEDMWCHIEPPAEGAWWLEVEVEEEYPWEVEEV